MPEILGDEAAAKAILADADQADAAMQDLIVTAARATRVPWDARARAAAEERAIVDAVRRDSYLRAKVLALINERPGPG